MTEERDPRHQLIIDLVMKYRDLGHDEKAKDLQEKAAKVETFPQLDALANTCRNILLFLDR